MTFRLRFGLEELDLAERETTIGRDPSCSISIDDDLVSRAHAVFRRHTDFIEVEDLKSRNGTRVNGLVIHGPTRLSHNDRVRIGPRELVFYDTEQAQPQGTGRRQSVTGKMALCGRCSEVLPEEAPSCPHCGAASDSSA
ncbi:hypothetical protein BH11MYX4_BH11MYX4_49110 [soil metagenome]